MKAVSELLRHVSTIITVGTYFDKNKIVVNCNKELDNYISMVKPREVNTTIIDVSDLNANDTCLELITEKTNGPKEVTNLATNLDLLKD